MSSNPVKIASFRGGKVELQDLHFNQESQTLTLLVETASLADWRKCERNNFIFRGLRFFGSSEREGDEISNEMESDGIYELGITDEGYRTFAFLVDVDSWFKIEALSIEAVEG